MNKPAVDISNSSLAGNSSGLIELPINGKLNEADQLKLKKSLGQIIDPDKLSIDYQSGRLSFSVGNSKSAQELIKNVLLLVGKAGLEVERQEREIDIFNMHCAGCVATIENGLQKVAGITDVTVNFATQSGTIRYINSFYTADQIIGDVKKLGYEADFHVEQDQAKSRDQNKKRDLIVTLISSALIIMLHLVRNSLGLVTISAPIFATLMFLLILPVLYGGRLFFSDAILQTIHFRANMNSLVALGSGTALLYSLYNSVIIFAGNYTVEPGLHFHTTAMILSFILFGRYLESMATTEARQAIMGMSELIPSQARIIREDGSEEEVDISELAVGSKVLIRPGESVASDGVVSRGESSVDESILTGEAMPVSKKPGDKVTGGTINLDGSLTIMITRTGAGTVVAGMIRMIREAQSAKAPIQKIADRVASIFVPIVILIATLTLIGWFIFAPDSMMLFKAPIAVLLVACPCALGLATPTAILVATGRAARNGIFFRNGVVLERLNHVTTFCFDKTGTLTEGKPVVEKIIPVEGIDEDRLLAVAATIERYSQHPFAGAIAEKARQRELALLPSESGKAMPGMGVSAVVEKETAIAGNREFLVQAGVDFTQALNMSDLEKDEGLAIVHVATGNRYLGALTLADSLKPGTADTVRQLSERGLDVIMLTGDNRFSAAATASKLGIKRIEAEMLPANKLNTIRSLSRSGFEIAMIGDGINDAAALTAADVGISLGTGTDVAIKASDITLTGQALNSILTAINISRETIKIIKQNIFWAFIYNIILIPIAAGLLYPINGLTLSPVMAAMAMAFSSVFVVTNSLRLKKIKIESKREVSSK